MGAAAWAVRISMAKGNLKVSMKVYNRQQGKLYRSIVDSFKTTACCKFSLLSTVSWTSSE
ncbi:hypothetical protein MPER_03137 [Moniliophthora perniciosa FA553]|nr:hypothetical protein MPER_03137 [Moniliophthora perniciosa FA553]